MLSDGEWRFVVPYTVLTFGPRVPLCWVQVMKMRWREIYTLYQSTWNKADLFCSAIHLSLQSLVLPPFV